MLIPIILAFALMSPDLDSPPKYKAWIQDHEVWMDTSAGPRRVVYDALAEEPIAASPSGDRVVYAVPDGKPVPEGLRSSMLVVIVDADGRSLAKFTPEEDSIVDAIEWIDSSRIGVWYCGHANCIYWVIDPNSGKTLQKFFGGFDFAWSHDRRYVARRHMGEINLNAKEKTDDLSWLGFNTDDKIVYPPVNPQTGHYYDRVLGYLTWSPDDKWVSFAETEYPSYDGYVVLVSPQRDVLRESLPVDVDYNAKIEWTDDNHFQITTSKRTFKFVVDGGKLHEFVEHAK